MEFVQDKIVYLCDDEFALVKKYEGNDSMVIIPDVVERRTVIGVYDKAFKDCISIRRVTIPDTVQKIGKEAFRNCVNLSEVCFYQGYVARNTHQRKNVLSIGEKAFMNCVLLDTLDSGNRYLSVKKEAFRDCGNINYVSTLVRAEAFCFKNCPYLEELFFADNFDFKEVNLFWTSHQKRYYLGKNATLDTYAIDFFKRKNIQINCSEKSTLTNLAYEGVNVFVEKM